MANPWTDFTKKDWLLWLVSLSAVIGANLAGSVVDWLTLLAALVGVTSLVFAAKGNVWAQILMVFFSVLYGILSWRVHYWGEMITYLGMTMPMAILSAISWLRNPADGGRRVAIAILTRRQGVLLTALTVIVTAVFYAILKAFDTPNLTFSTLSIATSFAAASLTIMRSSYYALAYATNDLVLIALWVLASINNPEYIPVIVNFTIFFINDMYGFWRWKQREREAGRQEAPY